MKTITTNKQEPYASFVKDGLKTVEGRLNRGKFAELKIGDIMEMNDERTPFKVISKNIYPTFRTMLEAEGISNVLPDRYTMDGGLEVYYEFYSKDEEKEFGVVAIHIKRLV